MKALEMKIAVPEVNGGRCVPAKMKDGHALAKLEIGEMIPPELYTVVAEILVFVDECDKIKGKVGK